MSPEQTVFEPYVGVAVGANMPSNFPILGPAENPSAWFVGKGRPKFLCGNLWLWQVCSSFVAGCQYTGSGTYR